MQNLALSTLCEKIYGFKNDEEIIVVLRKKKKINKQGFQKNIFRKYKRGSAYLGPWSDQFEQNCL